MNELFPVIMAGCLAHQGEGYISTSGLKSENFGDSAINKRYIAYFSLRMRETAVFSLPV